MVLFFLACCYYRLIVAAVAAVAAAAVGIGIAREDDCYRSTRRRVCSAIRLRLPALLCPAGCWSICWACFVVWCRSASLAFLAVADSSSWTIVRGFCSTRAPNCHPRLSSVRGCRKPVPVRRWARWAGRCSSLVPSVFVVSLRSRGAASPGRSSSCCS